MKTIKCGTVYFPHIEAILFDKNGTLEDSEIYLRSLAQKVSTIMDTQIPGVGERLLMAFGVNDNYLDPTGLMSVASRRETEVAAAAYIAETGRGWIESLHIACKILDEADKSFTQTTAPLFAGGLQILQKLSSTGLKLGILSAATTQEVQNFVTTHQLSN